MKLSVRGSRDLREKLEQVRPALEAGVRALALEAKGKIDRYPPAPRGRHMRVTARQRAFLRWAVKEGLIEVPYRRGLSPGSQALSKKWTIQIEEGGLRAVVGNNVNYGPFVQDREVQSRFHAETGWKTVQEVEEELEGRVQEVLGEVIRKALR